MAELMVLYTTADEIIGRLGSFGIQEMGLFFGVRGEINKLKSTFSTTHDVLLEADRDKQCKKNHQLKGCLEKLKEAVYEEDDLLDDFSTEALHRNFIVGHKFVKQVRIFFSSSNQLAFRLNMGHKIKRISKTLDAIAANRQKFHLVDCAVDAPDALREREHTHSFVREERVFGREDDKKAITELLLDFNAVDNVLIIPIVVIGGLGKTTLAQLVYNNDRVARSFELRLWACVSDVFSPKVVIEKILESATNEKTQNLEMNKLQNNLRKYIDGKRYLLVLDDVWNDDREKWIDLIDVLMGGAKGSRILVTTRSAKVARITSTASPYVLKGLSEDKAWLLFIDMAFEGKESKNPHLVTIGKDIVWKCAGVPLAIRTIGSLLYFRNTETEWLSFKDNELFSMAQQESDILPSLQLSYDHLPLHLKHCFTYCSLFSKTMRLMCKYWSNFGLRRVS